MPANAARASILIIGGTGFLGSHIADAFSRDPSFKVIVSSRRPPESQSTTTTWVYCDITNPSEATRLIESNKPTVIIHVATPSPFETAAIQSRHYEATRNLLEEAKRSPHVLGFIYAGSRDTVANASGFKPPGLQESDAIFHNFLSGPTPYARSKGACQSLVLESSTSPANLRKSASKATWVRGGFEGVLLTTVICTSGIYGPRDTALIPGVFRLPSRIQLGPNTSLHDWVYVENAAFSFVLAAKAILDLGSTSGVNGELFFITDGDPINFWDFARNMKAESGDAAIRDERRIYVIPWTLVLVLATINEWVSWVLTLGKAVSSFNPSLARHIKEGGVLDISKARDRLGYRPVISRDEGIKRSVRWFLQETSR
jgi:sterol-4alpha-carboxylate 3-dehydrogenase (decarboxylating)